MGARVFRRREACAALGVALCVAHAGCTLLVSTSDLDSNPSPAGGADDGATHVDASADALATVEDAAAYDTDAPNGAIVSPSNGHAYLFVASPEPGGITWEEANARAQQLGGHLVTITTADENTFVTNLALQHPSETFLKNFDGPFIGALKTTSSADPAAGWAWVTGEPWSFTSWSPNQPDDYFAPEDRAMLIHKPLPGWDDLPHSETHRAYIVEFE